MIAKIILGLILINHQRLTFKCIGIIHRKQNTQRYDSRYTEFVKNSSIHLFLNLHNEYVTSLIFIEIALLEYILELFLLIVYSAAFIFAFEE